MDEDMRALMTPVQSEFSRLQADTGELREEMDALAAGAERASRVIEAGLMRAVRSGKLGFEEMGRIALSVLAQIAQAAIRSGIEEMLGVGSGARGRSGGLLNLGASLLANLFGAPGRATGGPVAPGRAYLVGERGPEMFLPTSSGQVLPGVVGGSARDVRVTITVTGNGQDAPRALARSARQVARTVRGALAE